MGASRRSLGERLAAGETLVLDGATGTELHRRGVPTDLPLWSTRGLIERPEVVRAIHLDYARAGADVLVTNTFRTNRRALLRAGLGEEDIVRLNRLAVDLAREAREEAARPGVLVAGSLAPLEDCYSPWLSPPFNEALEEHWERARLLADAGVDLLLVETMPLASEAEAALMVARETGLEATVGFVGTPEERGTFRLLSGEPLAEAVARVAPHGPAAILVNCVPPPVLAAALRELRDLTNLPTGGYANLGHVDDKVGWEAAAEFSGERYAAAAAEWLAVGARIVGGCCGTTPDHIAALRALLDRTAPPAA
jgi:S-methylmethionine-dependent homocysteine/selenocysteine methylase